MPLTERMIKDLRFTLGDALRFVKNGLRLPVVVAWPDFPGSRTTASKICVHLNYRLTNKPLPEADAVLYFEDRTHGDSVELLRLYPQRKIINLHCTDISKVHTDRIHQTVFGYSLTIDPLHYAGIAMAKSDGNAMHDGRAVQCPLQSVEPGTVYQLIVDNSVDANEVMDFRVPVIGQEIPLAYGKFKSMEKRYTNEVSRTELLDPSAHFSKEELNQLVRFAYAMGAEFCELDVLRHRENGLIYVVDLNKTPYGPPAGMHPEARKKAIALLAVSFHKLCEEFKS